MGYGNRDKPERNSGRAGLFVNARLTKSFSGAWEKCDGRAREKRGVRANPRVAII